MPIDPSIPLGIKPYQGVDINQMLAERQALQMNRMKMAEAQRATQAKNAMREIFAAGGDPYDPETIRKIMSLDPSVGLELGKAAATMRRDAAGANKERIEAGAKALAMHRDLLAAVNDEAGYQAWRTSALADLPGAAGVIPATFSPAAKQQMMLDADKALKNHYVPQQTGEGQRVLRMPEYGAAPAVVVPGSEATLAPSVQFLTIGDNAFTGDRRNPAAGITPATIGGGAAPASASPVSFIKGIAALTPGMVTDDSRTTGEQAALRARGATNAGNNGPHVLNHGIDLKPQAFPDEASIRQFYADKGVKVAKIIDERRGGGTGPHWHVEFEPPQAPAKETVKQYDQRLTSENILKTVGYDPATGSDRMSELIPQSTSGVLQAGGAWLKGQATGEATPGMQTIAKIKTLANDITMALLGGKLGAQISNADVQFVKDRLADAGNPNVPANQRLSGWQEARDLLIRRLGSAAPPKAAPAKAPPKPAGGWSITKVK